MLRSRTIRRAQERRGAVSREWLQSVDREFIAAVDAASPGDVVSPTKKDRVRGMTADFITVDECDGPPLTLAGIRDIAESLRTANKAPRHQGPGRVANVFRHRGQWSSAWWQNDAE